MLSINLSHWTPHSVLSYPYFLSVRWINCISHSRKHVHTLSVVFRSVSVHSQWPISHFLSPRCTRAGENGQVRVPTVCQAAGYIYQLQNTAVLQNNNTLYIGCGHNTSYTKGTFRQTTRLDQSVFLHMIPVTFCLVKIYVALKHQYNFTTFIWRHKLNYCTTKRTLITCLYTVRCAICRWHVFLLEIYWTTLWCKGTQFYGLYHH